MQKLDLVNRACVLLALCAATAMTAPAQTFEVLYNFQGGVYGPYPAASLVQATDGNFYGTTFYGGTYGLGTIFNVSSGGALITLYSFGGPDGQYPLATLVQAADGNFYGTTGGGGSYGDYGTVFRITPTGSLTTLYSFCAQTGCTDGLGPQAGLVQATDGNFYGTTKNGGAYNYGTVFRITPTGSLTTLYSFCAEGWPCAEGTEPGAALIQGLDGNFYGTAFGGAYGYGTVFEMAPNGALTVLHSFGDTEGEYPSGALIQATDGNFYGTTSQGGTYGYGTVFRVNPTGTLTTLYSFCSQSGCTDGATPWAALVQGTDGNFYGITLSGGGANNIGTVFNITSGGLLSTLHIFCSQMSCLDGAGPVGGLIQGTNGSFYGTTVGGGAFGQGTVYTLSTGLGPFVETEPTSGTVGTVVQILGNNLTGATSLTFNGTPASFTILSASDISAIVPAGASTGPVAVGTPGGTLLSNVAFQVTGQGPIVQLSATSLTFGNQTIGTTSPPQSVTMTNTGTATLNITSIAASGDFAETNTCGSALAVGTGCTITVTFTPTATGTRTGAVTITDNASNSPQAVSLTGTGVGTPSVKLSPISLTFATQLVGTSSAAQTVTLTNTGNGTLSITSVAVTGTDPTDFSQSNNCGSSVAAGASCTINVTFKPTAKGTRTSSVSITDNASGSPQTLSLKGTGTVVKLSHASLNFGSVKVGHSSTPQKVTLTNTGSGSLSVTNIGITGTNAGDFSETNTCGSSLGRGKSCSISVTFTPRAKSSRTASLSISDSGGGSPQTVSLTGTGD